MYYQSQNRDQGTTEPNAYENKTEVLFIFRATHRRRNPVPVWRGTELFFFKIHTIRDNWNDQRLSLQF